MPFMGPLMVAPVSMSAKPATPQTPAASHLPPPWAYNAATEVSNRLFEQVKKNKGHFTAHKCFVGVWPKDLALIIMKHYTAAAAGEPTPTIRLSVTAENIQDAIRDRNVRLNELAKEFDVQIDELALVINRPGSGLRVARAGWVKLDGDKASIAAPVPAEG